MNTKSDNTTDELSPDAIEKREQERPGWFIVEWAKWIRACCETGRYDGYVDDDDEFDIDDARLPDAALRQHLKYLSATALYSGYPPNCGRDGVFQYIYDAREALSWWQVDKRPAPRKHRTRYACNGERALDTAVVAGTPIPEVIRRVVWWDGFPYLRDEYEKMMELMRRVHAARAGENNSERKHSL